MPLYIGPLPLFMVDHRVHGEKFPKNVICAFLREKKNNINTPALFTSFSNGKIFYVNFISCYYTKTQKEFYFFFVKYL